ncbi:3' terminal RNA ribose 2'-O-methyltransferase Hen1 [Steroidobacter cummioxidans]|uniref:3' terminal RNA ribose 2'-O-methyltransferase Hen1 n=1 Tax=Steroidobacter cummioxidans TaxID=1803913 RepID=UPI000E311E6E|nr:3' terminal RNA ribose 2'-O-methyltransferase Hen1 [Steroidobacter cummioxidans]
MLLTISTTAHPATDLGYLLHKNPARVHRFEQSFGHAIVFYPEATAERCTVCLLVDVDPVGLVRRRSGPAGDAGQLGQYVSDRPYVASSFISVALADVFGTAMTGRSKDRPELAASVIPLEVKLPVLPSRGGEALIRELFEPLGYIVATERWSLDERFPNWGESRYFSVTLSGTLRLQELLNHLYVLIPVLDDEKHYWVGDDEVEKLLRRGADWLPNHPAKEQIARRYLKYRKSLARAAMERLTPLEADTDDVPVAGKPTGREDVLEASLSLNQQRINTVVAAVVEAGAKSVVDLGCGEGKLLRELLRQRQLDRIVGVDVSLRALEFAEERLELARLGPAIRDKIKLLHGSLMYRDRRLQGFDAATIIEVVEHLDAPRLLAFERVVFGSAKPATVILTTPNVEYNARFPSLPAGQFRHPDHRFEWTRAEFETWAGEVATRNGYEVRFAPVGPVDPELGPPTQMAIFRVR